MPMLYKPAAEGKEVQPPKIGPTSFLGDIFTSEDVPEKQISCGFYRQVAGESLVYTYNYDEMKIVLEVGDAGFTLTDEAGYTVSVKPGDVLYFSKGTTITFTGEGYTWFCGLRQKDAL